MKRVLIIAILSTTLNMACLSYMSNKGLYIYMEEFNNNQEIVDDDNDDVIVIPEHFLEGGTIHDKLKINDLSVSNIDSSISVKWLYNKEDKEYYLYLPTSFNRKKLDIKFDIEEETIISVYDYEGNKLGDLYNEEVSSLFNVDKVTLRLETNVEKISEYKVNIISSNLPTIFIDVDGGNEAFKEILKSTTHSVSKTGKFTLLDTNGDILSVDMRKFKGRGNATWKRPKRPFAIKLDKKKSILGMKEANDWVLLANYPDGSLSRNAIFLYLASEIGLDYTPEYRPVDVFINNEYYGSFLITSKVESDKSRVDNNDDYLLEIDNHPHGDELTLATGKKITIHNPDLDDLTKEEQKELRKTLIEKLNKLESVMNDKNITKEELESYIDLESFAKYYWVQELSLNYDAQRGSNYFYYKDGIVYAGPIWDMDNTINRSYIFTVNTGYYILESKSMNKRVKNNWYRGLMNKKYFQELIDEVFINNIDLFLSLGDKLDEYYELIDISTKMNYVRWSYKEMMVEDPLTTWRSEDKCYQDSRNLLKSALMKRIKWYISQYITYDNFAYELIDNDGKIVTESFSKDKKVILSKSYAGLNMKIYGVLADGTKKELKEVELANGNNEIEIVLNKKATSSYKKINQTKYLLTFNLK